MLFESVFSLSHSAAAFLGERSIVCDSLKVRTADPDCKGRGTNALGRMAFATVPFAEVAIATPGDAFVELCAGEDFAILAVVCGVAVVRVVRGVLPGVVVGFARLEPLT